MSGEAAIKRLLPVGRSNVVDAVTDKLRAEILGGRIKAGARLPPERELSQALGVNRLTLRAALVRLEAAGLVVTRHGSGTVVAPWRERAGLEMLGSVLSSLREGEPTWVELVSSLLEARRFLAAEGVALAAVRHEKADLERLEAISAEQKLRLDDPEEYAKGDVAFQRALVRSARNIGLELILNSFVRLHDDLPEAVAQIYDRRDEVLGFYEAVIELVRQGDAETARAAVLAMLTGSDNDWLRRHT